MITDNDTAPIIPKTTLQTDCWGNLNFIQIWPKHFGTSDLRIIRLRPEWVPGICEEMQRFAKLAQADRHGEQRASWSQE